MCGIVGRVNLRTDEIVAAETLQTMLGAIRHRGPDEFGVYTFNDATSHVGLGSARLSIIDLSSGQQPMSNEDQSLWIVFNGEIFNYIELRQELLQQGHKLATQSDTEVIIHLYEQMGPACLDLLNGQFVFAIWDEKRRSLFIARDRIGIRPLHYTLQDGNLTFASEIKALLAHPGLVAALDAVALDQIFTFWSPLSPRTAFAGIATLPPGHWLLLQADGTMRVERYWEMAFPAVDEQKAGEALPEEDAAEQLRDLLVDATRLRLRADVPVGAYLSGGLDSSTITTLVHRYTPNHLETFSIAFTDAAFDESPFQEQMAAALGTRHNLVTCSHEDIGMAFPDVIWHTEVPLLRTSPVPLYLLSRLVHEHNFKVVLTGEGADEFLGGYNIFKEAKIRRFWARQPDSTMRPALLKKLYAYVGNLAEGNFAYLQRFFGQGLAETDDPYYSHRIRWHNTSRSKRFFSAELRATGNGNGHDAATPVALPPAFQTWSPLAQAQYLEATIFLPEYLLSSQGDRVGMAHSVEGRFPFLDHRVVEFCNALPAHYKLRGLEEKYLLKRAVRDLLPEAIWKRPKRPYRAPIHRAFFPDGRPLDWVANVLSPEQVAATGVFDPQAVTRLAQKIERTGMLGETDDMALAGILSTQLLHHHFITGYRRPQPVGTHEPCRVIRRGSAALDPAATGPRTGAVELTT
jgi:asparagine synthase (glutamine-hydrolysing)